MEDLNEKSLENAMVAIETHLRFRPIIWRYGRPFFSVLYPLKNLKPKKGKYRRRYSSTSIGRGR